MKKYVFKPYSNTFQDLFRREKERIVSGVKESIIIEHVGSTAVPNLGGKGIIDIAIAAEYRKIKSIFKRLQNLGYEFRPTGGSAERFFFQIKLPDKEDRVQTYHIHLVNLNSKEWKRMLAFRDYLRKNPEDVKKYATSKKNAAQEANEDRDKYMSLKTPAIEEILEKILKEQKLP